MKEVYEKQMDDSLLLLFLLTLHHLEFVHLKWDVSAACTDILQSCMRLQASGQASVWILGGCRGHSTLPAHASDTSDNGNAWSLGQS